jgi:hypothetical protein
MIQSAPVGSDEPLNGVPEWIPFDPGIEGDISYVTVANSSATRLTLEVSLPGMYVYPIEMADGKTYTAVSIPGSGLFEVGKPLVPIFGNWILIPNGTETELQIDPGEPLIFDDIEVPPVQQPWAELEDAPIPPFIKDEEVYNADADYPGVFAHLEATRIMRGQECTLIWLYPYHHNPIMRTLSVYPDLSVTVHFLGEASPIPPRLQSEPFDLMMRRTAINADAVLGGLVDATEVLPMMGLSDNGPPVPYQTKYGWDYIIITHPRFKLAADKLAAWRRKTGFKTHVSVDQNWQASQIKTRLQQAYNAWDIPPVYILIIGDAEFIPCFYQTWHWFNDEDKREGRDPSQGYIGTDLYYTTMGGGTDYTPDISIGRLSVDTSTAALDWVDRIIDYEKNPTTDRSFYDNVAICSYFQDDKYPSFGPDGIADRRFAQTSEDVAIFLHSIGKSVNRIYYAKPEVIPMRWSNNAPLMAAKNFDGPFTRVGGFIPNYLRKPSFAWDGDHADIKAALEGGCFLLTQRDHGGRTKWSHPYYDSMHLRQVQIPAGKYPVVWSMSCQTGWFDNETDFKKKPGIKDQTHKLTDSFSEVFTTKMSWPRGPVGIIAATRVADSIYSDSLFLGLTDAIWPHFVPKDPSTKSNLADVPLLRMGDVLNYGKDYMYETMSKTMSKKEIVKQHNEIFHWFGDPAMQIRTREPSVPLKVINFPKLWPWATHPSNLNINVLFDPPSPFDRARLTVTISNPEAPSDYWRGTPDEEGNLTFPDLITSTLGEYEVVVTAPNCIPVQETFESQAGPSGGILLDAVVYSCSSEIEIKVADAHLTGLGTQDVSVSASGEDEETVTLIETGTGMFVGTISTASGEVVQHDGTLQVSDSETISADYYDQADITGNPASAQDTAVIDSQPPVFGGLKSATVANCCVELQWDAASDLHGPITYNIFRHQTPGPPIGNLIANTWALFYADYDIEPGRTYYYVVRAQDGVGNEDGNIIEKGYTFLATSCHISECVCDLNADGKCDPEDLAILSDGNPDLNGDGKHDAADQQIFADAWLKPQCRFGLVSCELIPDAAVLQRGDTLGINASVTNLTDEKGAVSFGTKVKYPNGSQTDYVWGPFSFGLDPHETKSGHKTHTVPSNIPFGSYAYQGFATVNGMGTIAECEFLFDIMENAPF